MKYFETILIILFFALIATLWFNRTEPTQTDFRAKIDSLESQIQVINSQVDSISKIERTLITKKTTINHYYDSTKTTIIYLPDSANFELLQSNLNRYDYLYNAAPSQSN